MTATYFRHRRGRSRNAEAAEIEGRQPLTRAKQAVSAEYGCTQVVAAAALKLLHDGEWHHVGKHAKACDYYDTEDERLPGVIAHILACGGPRKFTERRERLRTERFRNMPAIRNLPTGRIVGWQDRRQKERETTSEAIGEPITERHRVRDWEAMVALQDQGTDVIAAGWSRQRVALACANGCWSVDAIRQWIKELGL